MSSVMVELSSDRIGLPGRLVKGVDTKPRGNSEVQSSPVGPPGQVPAVPKGTGITVNLRASPGRKAHCYASGYHGLHLTLRVSGMGCGVMCLFSLLKSF